jgi:hypothetical protein
VRPFREGVYSLTLVEIFEPPVVVWFADLRLEALVLLVVEDLSWLASGTEEFACGSDGELGFHSCPHTRGEPVTPTDIDGAIGPITGEDSGCIIMTGTGREPRAGERCAAEFSGNAPGTGNAPRGNMRGFGGGVPLGQFLSMCETIR